VKGKSAGEVDGGVSEAERSDARIAQAGDAAPVHVVATRAAPDPVPAPAIELRCQASVQLLTAGRVDQARTLLAEVLRELGMPLARSAWIGRARAAWQRLRLTMRGFVFRQREENAIHPAQLARLDALFACSMCLEWFDAVASVEYFSRHTRLALDAGEPGRIAVSLAMEAVVVDALSPRSRRANALLERGAALARRGADPRVRARAECARVRLLFTRGEPGVLSIAERALASLGECDMLASMEAVLVRDALMHELVLRGELARAADLALALSTQAEQRDDALTITVLATGVAHGAWLVRDGVDEAERRLQRARELWVTSAFDRTRLRALHAEIGLAFYADAPERAWASLERDRTALEASGLLRAPSESVVHALARGATAAWLARRPGKVSLEHAALMDLAEAAARLAERGVPNDLEIPALAFRTALAFARGEPDAAAMHLRAIIAHGEERPAAMFAAAARRRLGQLIGGDDGAALLATGEAAMRAQSVAVPEAMTRYLLPGCHAD
jgi:hypothetical protein